MSKFSKQLGAMVKKATLEGAMALGGAGVLGGGLMGAGAGAGIGGLIGLGTGLHSKDDQGNDIGIGHRLLNALGGGLKGGGLGALAGGGLGALGGGLMGATLGADIGPGQLIMGPNGPMRHYQTSGSDPIFKADVMDPVYKAQQNAAAGANRMK